MRYLPFGKEIKQTEQQKMFEKRKFERYDYYGIPYGMLDGDTDEGTRTDREEDIEKARLLIMQGEEIPKELADRLLMYKEQESKKE